MYKRGFSFGTAGGGGVAGLDTYVQFNDGGVLGADAGLTYNKTTNILTVAGSLIAGGSANRIGTATTVDATADTLLATSATTQKGLVVQMKAGQTAHPFSVQTSAGVPTVSVQSDGGLIIDQRTSATYSRLLAVYYQGTEKLTVLINSTQFAGDIVLDTNARNINWGGGTGLHCISGYAGLDLRNGTTAQQFSVANTYTGASDYERLSLKPGAAAGWMQLAAETAGTGTDDISIAVSPAGFGSVSAHVPDSTAAGGNARGQQSVDWQTARDAATKVASGYAATIGGGIGNTASSIYATVAGGSYNTVSNIAAVIAGGNFNTASGNSSAVLGGQNNVASSTNSAVVGGRDNVASAQYSVAGGGNNTASGEFSTVLGGSRGTTRGLYGANAYASGRRGSDGDAQRIFMVLRNTTTTTDATTLTANGAVESTTNVMVLPINSSCVASCYVTATHAAGAAAGGWKVEGTFRRGASGNAVLVGATTITAFGVDAAVGAPTVDLAVMTGAGAGGIAPQVTAANTTTTYWVSKLEIVQAA